MFTAISQSAGDISHTQPKLIQYWAYYDSRLCVCVYLADREGVPVQLLSEHESLCEHGFVIVGVLDDGRGGGVAKHRAYVTFKRSHHGRHQLLVPVEEIQTHNSYKHVHTLLK